MTYVDPSAWPFGRMMMCHLLADSLDELHEMAGALKMRREWFQHHPGKTPHYDLSKSKRAEAIRLGAIEISPEEAVQISRRLRAGQSPAGCLPRLLSPTAPAPDAISLPRGSQLELL